MAKKTTKKTTEKTAISVCGRTRNYVLSICSTQKPKVLPRKYVPLGRSIRQGFVDGISEENSPLLHNAFDSEHGVQDPYFSFGNDTIGRDKFERAVKFNKQKQALEKEQQSQQQSQQSQQQSQQSQQQQQQQTTATE